VILPLAHFAAGAPPAGALLAPPADAGALLAGALLAPPVVAGAEDAGAELAALVVDDAALVVLPALEPELLPHADAAIATRTPTDAT
jgi:hypothetical protein